MYMQIESHEESVPSLDMRLVGERSIHKRESRWLVRSLNDASSECRRGLECRGYACCCCCCCCEKLAVDSDDHKCVWEALDAAE